MRRDLIIGIIFSFCVHGGVAWLGEKLRPGPKKIVHEAAETIQLMEMPKLDDPDPEPVETDQDVTPIEFAPPTQTDVPQIVTQDSFVQQLQPPPPEGFKPTAGVVNIPQGRPGGLGKGIEVFDVSKLDTQPQARIQGKPIYPIDMRRSGIAGEVLVEFIIDTNGDVQNAFAVRSSQREFEAPAVQAVSKWKFRPGKKGGRVVNSRRQIPIVFSLNEE